MVASSGATPMGRRSLVAFIGAASVACSSSAPPSAPTPAPVAVPAGVDSSVAAYADSLAGASLVAVARQDESAALQQEAQQLLARSDAIWSIRPAPPSDPSDQVTAEDSVQADAATTNGGQALVQLDALLREPPVDRAELAGRTAALLDSAQAALERAFALNPFDSRSKLWLTRVYELQARRLGQLEAYDRAIDELEKLARLTPDEHAVFAMLANNYFRLSRWEPAANGYRRARQVYLSTYDLTAADPGPLDSALVFSYIRAEADMHVRQQRAEPAVTAFRQSLAYTNSAADSAYVHAELAWIAWDAGNIRSSDTRDSLLALENAGDLAAAATGYHALLTTLTTRRAIDEIDWRLAIVEYNLDRAEPAVERLQALVARTTTNVDGVPLDSTYLRYVEDYGTLCLNLGRQHLQDRSDNRTALKYFEQASRLAWSGRGVAHLEIATLVQGNVDAALEHAGQSLAHESSLTVEHRQRLYRLLMELYRRSGDFEAARHYRDAYRSLRNR